MSAGPMSARPVSAALAPAVPLARVALLRRLIYPFVIVDIFLFVNDVVPHAAAPGDLYKPLLLRRALGLPEPSLFHAETLRVVLVIGCLVAASGLLPRLSGFVVAAAFTDWVSIGYSFGKIDHDHFALVVALWVLPTVGRASSRQRRRSEAAGWALLCIQVAVVCCYFLSAVAKVRFGGWDWVTGATFTWAVVRRGTPVGDLLLSPAWLLVAGQFVLFALEATSPVLLFLRGRALYVMVAVFAGFHLMTWISITIHFLPHVVCLAAFLPLERIAARGTARLRSRGTERAVPRAEDDEADDAVRPAPAS